MSFVRRRLMLRLSLLINRAQFSSSGAGARGSSAVGSVSYCVELVKRHDYEHYLCCLLLPKKAQAAAFAVRAFNVEVAQIRDSVSDSKIGQMRIQYWRDLITAIYEGQSPSQPVAAVLAQAVRRHKLSKIWLNRILEARSGNLDNGGFVRTQDLEDYAEQTFSSMHYLTLEAMGARDVNADHTASHLGKAEGVVTILRAVPYHRAARRVTLPMDILMRHGVSQEDIIRGEVTQEVRDATYDCASLAHTHLLKARNLRGSLPKSTLRAFLSAVPCEAFLQRIQQCGFDPLDPGVLKRRAWLPVSLLKAAWTNTF